MTRRSHLDGCVLDPDHGGHCRFAPWPPPGARRPAPDTVPTGIPIRATADAPTAALQVPATTAEGLRLPPSDAELQRAMERRAGPDLIGLVKVGGPVLIALVRLAIEIYEEVHFHGEHPPLP